MVLKFAWRYLRSKKSTNAINIIAWISMVAIGVVTAALVVVLSVFNGFEDLVKEMYGDFYADVQVTPDKGKWLELSPAKYRELTALPGVAHVEPIIEERAILIDQEEKSIVWLKGVSSNYKEITGTARHMVRGSFFVGDSASPAVVMGIGVESALQIIAGQTPFPLTVYMPNPEAVSGGDITSSLISGNAAATGAFAVQQEFDDQHAFTHIGFMQYMLGSAPHRYTGIEIFTSNGSLPSRRLIQQVQAITGPGVVVKDRFQQNQSLFAAMQTEKVIIYAIAFLILLIAGFNIISSLTMTILEKQKDIALLQAMGASPASVTRIFIAMGLLLSALGAGAGFLLGLLICAGQQKFHWVKLAGESFIIDYYPVAVRLGDLAGILVLVVVIAFFAAWLPARRSIITSYSLRS